MNAIVVVRYTVLNICEQRDLEDSGLTFDAMVRQLIESEGILGLCELPDTIISIESA